MVRKGRYCDETVVHQDFLITITEKGERMDILVKVSVDLRALASELGPKAHRNKSGKATAACGRVEVKIVDFKPE